MIAKKKIIWILLIVSIASIGSVIAVYVNTNYAIPNTPGKNYQVLKFVSASMEPTIKEGSYILVDTSVNASDLNSEYPNSDIIVFHIPGNPNELIAHRIVAKEEIDGVLYFRTKGDANGINKWPATPQPSEYDPWREGGVPGVSEYNIVGKVVNTNYK